LATNEEWLYQQIHEQIEVQYGWTSRDAMFQKHKAPFDIILLCKRSRSEFVTDSSLRENENTRAAWHLAHTRTNQRMTSPRTTAKCVVDMPSICLLVSSVAWAICSVVEMSAPTSRHTMKFMNTWNMLYKKTVTHWLCIRRGQTYKIGTWKLIASSFLNWSVAVCMGVVERVGRSNRQDGPAYNE